MYTVILLSHLTLFVYILSCYPIISCQWQISVPPSLTFTARPLLIDNSGLTSSPPHINVSVNSLCQRDEYTITVQFGVRAVRSMGCDFQQNVTIMNGGKVDVPSDIIILRQPEQEYCYTAVLSDVAGNRTPSMRTFVYSSIVCLCSTNNINST